MWKEFCKRRLCECHCKGGVSWRNHTVISYHQHAHHEDNAVAVGICGFSSGITNPSITPVCLSELESLAWCVAWAPNKMWLFLQMLLFPPLYAAPATQPMHGWNWGDHIKSNKGAWIWKICSQGLSKKESSPWAPTTSPDAGMKGHIHFTNQCGLQDREEEQHLKEKSNFVRCSSYTSSKGLQLGTKSWKLTASRTIQKSVTLQDKPLGTREMVGLFVSCWSWKGNVSK